MHFISAHQAALPLLYINRARAGEAEFASWREVMLTQREWTCPNGQGHVVHASDNPPVGIYGVCMRCGHEIRIPF